jgi:hypothetical protein
MYKAHGQKEAFLDVVSLLQTDHQLFGLFNLMCTSTTLFKAHCVYTFPFKKSEPISVSECEANLPSLRQNPGKPRGTARTPG